MKTELENTLIEKGVEGVTNKIENIKLTWFVFGMGLMGIICLMIYYK